MMKIIYAGNSKSIVRNLLELGVEEVIFWEEFKGQSGIDGVIVTKDLSLISLEKLRSLRVPIILSSGKTKYQRDVDVLILDEDEMNIFNGLGTWDIPKCREQLRKLGIKHLVVSLGKEETKKRIQQLQISKINVKEVEITDEEIEREKDVITAIIGYIYIKDGLLMPDSIEKAKVGAILEVIGMKKDTSYHLKFNIKKR